MPKSHYDLRRTLSLSRLHGKGSSMTSPRSIQVFLPMRKELAHDPECAVAFTQGLIVALRQDYPDSILEVAWKLDAEHIQIDLDGEGTDVREMVAARVESFAQLWLVALRSVRNYLNRCLRQQSQLLDEPGTSQLSIVEVFAHGQERELFSRRRPLL